MRHRTVRSARIPAVLLLTYLSACASWQVQTLSPEQVLADPQNASKTVRLTTVQGGRLQMSHPQVTGDSVAGLQRSLPITLALSDIRETATKHTNVGGTVAVVALGFLAVGGVVAAIFLHNLAAQN